MKVEWGRRILTVALATGLLTSIGENQFLAYAQPPITNAAEDDVKKEISGVVRGQVVGQDGKPAAKVDVWAVWSEIGIRETRYTRHAITDGKGAYELENIIIRSGVTIRPPTKVTLIATRDGTPPAVVAEFATKTRVAVAPVIQMTSEEGTLSVTVLDKSGVPAAGCSVEATAAAYERDAPARLMDNLIFNDKEAHLLRRALVPRAVTDANGVARLTHLRPDNYRLVAARFPADTKHSELALVPEALQKGWRTGDKTFAVTEKVVVVGGDRAQATLRLDDATVIKRGTSTTK